MGMLEKFIARQAADLAEKTEAPGPEPVWSVEFDVTVSLVGGDREMPFTHSVDVEAPDIRTAAWKGALGLVELTSKGADQRAAMAHFAQKIVAQFSDAGDAQRGEGR